MFPTRVGSLRFAGLVVVLSAVASSATVAACSSGTFVSASPEGGSDGAAPEELPPDDAATTADANPQQDATISTVSAIYSTVLLSQLAFGDPAKAFKFYATVSYDSSSRTITKIDLTPLRSASTTVSKTQTIGTTISKTSVPVSPSGRFVLSLGTITIPGDANPISAREVVIENAILTGAFAAPGTFCSRMSGTVVAPVTLELEPEKNIALHAPASEDDALPTRTSASFVCTVPAS